MIKTIQQKIYNIFTSKTKKKERAVKDLLRENLALLPVDIFYLDDPRIGIPPDKLVEYDKKFYDICRDSDIMNRFKYLINKQALLTIHGAQGGSMDSLGTININGMATIKDDFTRLGNSYLKAIPSAEPFNKYNII